MQAGWDPSVHEQTMRDKIKSVDENLPGTRNERACGVARRANATEPVTTDGPHGSYSPIDPIIPIPPNSRN